MDGLLEMDVKHVSFVFHIEGDNTNAQQMLRIHVFVKGEYISPNRRRGDTVTSDKVNLAMPNRIFIHFDSINAKNEINNLLQKSDRRTANSDGRTAIAGKCRNMLYFSRSSPCAKFARTVSLPLSFDVRFVVQ